MTHAAVPRDSLFKMSSSTPWPRERTIRENDNSIERHRWRNPHTRVHTDARAHTHTYTYTHTHTRAGQGWQRRRGVVNDWSRPASIRRSMAARSLSLVCVYVCVYQGERERERGETDHDGVESAVRHFGRALSIDRLLRSRSRGRPRCFRALDGAPDLEGCKTRERRRADSFGYFSLRGRRTGCTSPFKRSWTSYFCDSPTPARARVRTLESAPRRSLLYMCLSPSLLLSPSVSFSLSLFAPSILPPLSSQRRLLRTPEFRRSFVRHANFFLRRLTFFVQNDSSFSSYSSSS